MHVLRDPCRDGEAFLSQYCLSCTQCLKYKNPSVGSKRLLEGSRPRADTFHSPSEVALWFSRSTSEVSDKAPRCSRISLKHGLTPFWIFDSSWKRELISTPLSKFSINNKHIYCMNPRPNKGNTYTQFWVKENMSQRGKVPSVVT